MLRALFCSVSALLLVAGAASAADRPDTTTTTEKPDKATTEKPDKTGGRLFDVDHFFERFDKNNDGFIQRDELPERFRHAFDRIDTNKDGKLSKEEVEKGFVHLQRERRPADLIHTLVEMSETDEASLKELQYMYDLLRKMDKDKSGKLNTDDMKAMREQIVADRVDEIIKDLDVDNDGKISKEEARGRLKEDFDKIDANKDGFIDREELMKAAMARADKEKDKEHKPAPKKPSSDR